MNSYYAWERASLGISTSDYKQIGPVKVSEFMEENGIKKDFDNLRSAGKLMPAALLYTVFGAPHLVQF